MKAFHTAPQFKFERLIEDFIAADVVVESTEHTIMIILTLDALRKSGDLRQCV